MPSLKDPHGGTGEVGLPPIAITITNAIAAGTGANPRQLPMTPERIKAAMTG
jgi:CO/xanthine dehydrogenase Mo-binding subunit